MYGRKRIKGVAAGTAAHGATAFQRFPAPEGKGRYLQDSYKIEIYVNLYEIFAAHTDSLTADMIRRLLYLNIGILETVYQEWLGREDSFFEELRVFACSEIENIAEMDGNGQGKDDEDGKGFNQAA